MKILHGLTFSIALLTTVFARDFRPDGSMENLSAADGSIQQCYTFRTLPGVRYRVESSPDMTQWTTQDEIYGLGHEYVVSMREFTPSPPPEPGNEEPAPPETPAITVSVVFRPSSGTAGGTLVSWASLDHGGPVNILLAQTMASGWSQIPLFWNRYGDHWFFVLTNNSPIAPPMENPPLGIKDAAIFTQLETSFSEMNQAVDDSAAVARNTPPPAPPDPNSRKFWRIHCDWSIDTDQDGSPDWAEFEMAARGTGSLVAGVLGDAFDADSNGDGVLDGEQLDLDLDGTADVEDTDLDDALQSFPLTDLPRYAVFPLINPDPNVLGYQATQINDRGTVLFRRGVWSGGEWKYLDIPTDPDDAERTGSIAINDNDVILGRTIKSFINTENDIWPWDKSVMCFWNDVDSDLQFVTAGSGDSERHAVPFGFESGSNNAGHSAPLLSNDGYFSAFNYSKNLSYDNKAYIIKHPSRWRLPSGGSSATESEDDHRLVFSEAPDVRWGDGYPLMSPDQGDQGDQKTWENTSEPITRLIYAPDLLPPLFFTPAKVLAYPDKPVIALPDAMEAFTARNYNGMAYHNGQWHANTIYANANDLSADGTAIGKSHDVKIAPILLNGTWTDISKYAPDLPEIWQTDVRNMDTTPRGWVLQELGNYYFPDSFSVLLPIRVEGQFVNEFGAVMVKSSGVDNISIQSSEPGETVKERIWIMAPQGVGTKTVVFNTPLNSNTPLHLSADGLDFGGTNGEAILTNENNTFTIRADESVSSGSDISLTLKMGEVSSLSNPIGVKVMKGRTVKVMIHLVASEVDGRALNAPNIIPNEEAIKKYLNDVYRPQVNVTFDVKINPMVNLKWDIATSADFGVSDPDDSDLVSPGNRRLDFFGSGLGKEEGIINDALNDSDVNINVYVLGGASMVGMYERDGELHQASVLGAYGYAKRNHNVVFIDGDADVWDRIFDRDSVAENKHVIAHEIGHCIIENGHPDEGTGPAALPGLPPSEYPDRLMISGKKVRRPNHGTLLVKGEWDKAEEWLDSNIKDEE